MSVEEHRVVIGVDYVGQQDVQKYLFDLQRMGAVTAEQMARMRAMMSGQLALPAGGGQPRIDGRFASRQAVLERQQDEFVRGLRKRIQAEDALTRTTMQLAAEREKQLAAMRRSVGFAERVGSPRYDNLQFGLGPGGNIEATFVRASDTVGAFTRRVQSLTQQLAQAEASFNPSRQAVNRQAADVNRQMLEALANRYAGAGVGQVHSNTIQFDESKSYRVADELRRLSETLTTANEMGRILLHSGKANSTLLNGLSPETREVLIGTPEPPRALGITTREQFSWPVQGLIGRGDARSQLFDAQYGGLQRMLRDAEQNLATVRQSYALPGGREQLALPQTSTATQMRLEAALRRRAAAEERAARAAEGVASSTPRAMETPYQFVGWHGTRSPLPEQLLPVEQIQMANAQKYGRAFYSSPNRFNSQLYATGEQGGYLYRAYAPAGAKRLDLTSQVAQDDLQSVIAALRAIGSRNTAGILERASSSKSLTYNDLYGYGGGLREMVNDLARLKGYSATEIPGEQTMWLNPERLRTSLAQYVPPGRGGTIDGVPLPGTSAVHVPGLGSGTSMPEYERALKAVRERAAAEEAAARAARDTAAAGRHLTEDEQRRAVEEERAAAAAFGAGGGRSGGNGGGGGRLPMGGNWGADRGGNGGSGGYDGRNYAGAGDEGFGDFIKRLLQEARGLTGAAAETLMQERLAFSAAKKNLEAVQEKYNVGIGNKGGYGSLEQAELDAVRKSRTFIQARERLLQAEEKLAAAEQGQAQFIQQYDALMRAQAAAMAGRTPLMLTAGTGGPGLQGYYSQQPPPGSGGGSQFGGYRITGQNQAQWTAWMQQAGVIPTPQQTPLSQAQANLASATQRLAAAQQAHQQTVNASYASQQAAGQAYTASLYRLSQAQQAQYQAQMRLNGTQNLIQGNMQANFQAAHGGGGINGTGMGTFGSIFGGGGGGVGGGGVGGPPGGFWGNFAYGFHGRQDKSYAEQLGQTFKFSVFYGTAYKLLFALTQTLSQSVQEGIAFQDAMTNLKIAAGKPAGELQDLGRTLGDQSVRAGFAPSQGVEIGARSLGLYGLAGAQAPLEDQQRVAEISARVVSQMAVGSKKDPVALQGDIAAIAQALGTGAYGQQMIADLDAYMTKRFGVQQGSTLEAVGQSATVGKAAGFSDQQLFAIAADMISRTGQSPTAIGGYMAQIFSRGGEGSLVSVAQNQGIDPNQDLAKIVQQLADLYRGADPRTQAEISAAFGRGKVQNAAVALLSDYNQVNAASSDSLTKAQGTANQQFEEHMRNIGGQIRELGGVLKELANQIGQAGLLDALGAGVIALKALAEAATQILGLWNALPRPMRDVIIGLGLLSAALNSQALQNLISTAALRGGGSAIAYARTAGMIGPAGVVARDASGAIVPVAAASTTVAKGLLRMVGPIGLAIGGLLAIGDFVKTVRQQQEALDAGTQTLLAGRRLGPDSSAADYRSQSAELSAQADANRKATGWFTNAITFGLANNNNMAEAKMLEREATRLANVAKQVDAASATSSTSPTFRGTTADDLKAGLDAIQSSGGTATTQLQALRGVLYGTAEAAKAARDAFDPKRFAASASAGLQGAGLQALNKDLQVGRVYVGTNAATGAVYKTMTGKDIRTDFSSIFTGTAVQGQLAKSLSERGIQSEGDLTDKQAGAVAGDVANALVAKYVKGAGKQYAAAQPLIAKAVREALKSKLLSFVSGTQDALGGSSLLSDEDATAFANSLVAASDARLGTMGETDFSGRISEIRKRIQDLKKTQSRAKSPLPSITLQVGQAQKLLVDNQLAELDAMRKVAMQNAKTKQEANREGHALLQQAINDVVANGTGDQLVALIASAGHGAIVMAKKAIQEALRVARAALAVGAEMQQFGQEIDGQVRGRAAAWRGDAAAKNNQVPNETIKRLNKLDKALKDATYAGPEDNKWTAKGSGVYNPNWPDGAAAKTKETDSPAEIAAARASAFAARSEGQIRAAQAAVQTARASMAKAKKNTVEYWNAVGQLFEAQNQLTDAIQAFQKNRMILHSDITNPLKMARIDSRAAAIKLRSDLRQGKAADVIAQDRVDARQAQANRESTAFSQRLQAIQTADQLGRISHQRYLQYLDHEKHRLQRIGHRTFQQQQELDQIDGLLQDAAKQMQGQFNLGSIHLPTPYQVRRYIEQASGTSIAKQVGASKAVAATSVTNVTMNVNGADVAKVKQVVQDVVGKTARTRTVTPRRR